MAETCIFLQLANKLVVRLDIIRNIADSCTTPDLSTHNIATIEHKTELSY